jgi:hypothetical protein
MVRITCNIFSPEYFSPSGNSVLNCLKTSFRIALMVGVWELVPQLRVVYTCFSRGRKRIKFTWTIVFRVFSKIIVESKLSVAGKKDFKSLKTSFMMD